MIHRCSIAGGFLSALLMLAGCGQSPAPAPVAPAGPLAPVQVRAAALAQPAPCIDTFVAHTLDYATQVEGDAIHLFDSNG
jgi:hypothetical protein